jgi:hypothetical protein
MSVKKNDKGLETNMDERISRRSFIRWSAAGVGVAASLPLLSGSAKAAQSAKSTAVASGESAEPAAEVSAAPLRSPERLAADRALAELVAPIAVGTVLGAARVEAIEVDDRGIGVVTLADGRGRRWDAEICRRAERDANVRPLAVSKGYSVYLRNNGSGSVPTDEKIGRAVLAIGQAVRRNEAKVPAIALRSREELWRSQGFVG